MQWGSTLTQRRAGRLGPGTSPCSCPASPNSSPRRCADRPGRPGRRHARPRRARRRPARGAPTADPRRPRPRPAGARAGRAPAGGLLRPHPSRACRLRPHRRRPRRTRPAPGRRRPVRPRRVVAAARRRRARLLLRPRRRPRHADGPGERADRRGRAQHLPADELARVLREYGEERFAVPDRRRRGPPAGAGSPLRRSAELVELLYEAVPAASRRTGGHPAKRTFQALRIEVNGELDALRAALPAALDALAVGGRIVVLAYHSLEDRIVKRELTARAHVADAAGPAGRAARARAGAPAAHPRRRGRRGRRDRRQPAGRLGPAARGRTDPGGRRMSVTERVVAAPRRDSNQRERHAGERACERGRSSQQPATRVEPARASADRAQRGSAMSAPSSSGRGRRTRTALRRRPARPRSAPARTGPAARPRIRRGGPPAGARSRRGGGARARAVRAHVMGLLGVGLVATLWLSTAAAADSYRLQDARTAARELSERSERLHREVAVLRVTTGAGAAGGELGMVPAENPARLVVAPDGAVEVVGEPRAAVAPPPVRAARWPGRRRRAARPVAAGPGVGTRRSRRRRWPRRRPLWTSRAAAEEAAEDAAAVTPRRPADGASRRGVAGRPARRRGGRRAADRRAGRGATAGRHGADSGDAGPPTGATTRSPTRPARPATDGPPVDSADAGPPAPTASRTSTDTG